MANVRIKNDRYTTDSLYQWDRNQVLTIYGLSLPSIPEIHFANAVIDKAIVKQATMDDAGIIKVEIPNELLDYPNNIDVYICTYEKEAFQALYKITIPVEAKKKPENFIASDNEKIYSYNALENKVDNTLKLSLLRYDNAVKLLNETIDETDKLKNWIQENVTSVSENAERAEEARAKAEEAQAKANVDYEEIRADYIPKNFVGATEKEVTDYTSIVGNPDSSGFTVNVGDVIQYEVTDDSYNLNVMTIAGELVTISDGSESGFFTVLETYRDIQFQGRYVIKIGPIGLEDAENVSDTDYLIIGNENGSKKIEFASVKQKITEEQNDQISQLSEELEAETTAREQAVASLNERLGQQTVLVAEGKTQEEAETWLKSNGDTTKLYLMPDETFWQYKATTEVVESGGGYTNLIDGTNGYIKEGYRYSSSSAAFKEYTAIENFASIVIPVPTSGELTIRVRGMVYRAAYPTIYGGTSNTAFSVDLGTTRDTYDDNGDWCFTFSNTSGSTHIVTTGELTTDAGNVICTVNEEIVEGETTTVIVEKWVSTGHGLIATNYDEIIATLNSIVNAHTEEIQALKDGSGIALTDVEKLEFIKNWDSPIYDANIPVFQLSAEKEAMTNATNTPDNIYAKYDALMAKHSRYITKTDLGLCSDGVNHVYRYDFKEPEPLHESGKVWSETKTKAIIVTGIHFEWAGIYAMYNALEEIADNPELRNFRRNTHLIVVPVANPFATIATNYDTSTGVRNANGVEIHRNFEVDHTVIDSSNTHYGGATPLSEVETQYIDNIMKNNTDAALFLSCHNCGVDTFWGTGFIWASTATKYMCNMGYRLIDKLSDAWMDKYGDVLSVGIEEYKTDLLEDGETRLGWTGLSTSAGTEAKQATKYGIQGTNVEICNPFQIHGTKANPEPSMSAFTMSRGAEVYINFLLTALGVYDYKDKEQYYK